MGGSRMIGGMTRALPCRGRRAARRRLPDPRARRSSPRATRTASRSDNLLAERPHARDPASEEEAAARSTCAARPLRLGPRARRGAGHRARRRLGGARQRVQGRPAVRQPRRRCSCSRAGERARADRRLPRPRHVHRLRAAASTCLPAARAREGAPRREPRRVAAAADLPSRGSLARARGWRRARLGLRPRLRLRLAAWRCGPCSRSFGASSRPRSRSAVRASRVITRPITTNRTTSPPPIANSSVRSVSCCASTDGSGVGVGVSAGAAWAASGPNGAAAAALGERGGRAAGAEHARSGQQGAASGARCRRGHA